MSFAIWYACYSLLKNSSKLEENKPVFKQTYVHHKPIKSRKSNVNSLRKKFNNNHRGGTSL